jgi:hypothetical protein
VLLVLLVVLVVLVLVLVLLVLLALLVLLRQFLRRPRDATLNARNPEPWLRDVIAVLLSTWQASSPLRLVQEGPVLASL